MKRLNLTPIEDYITEDHGVEGTSSRMEFESNVDAFILGEHLKAELDGHLSARLAHFLFVTFQCIKKIITVI